MKIIINRVLANIKRNLLGTLDRTCRSLFNIASFIFPRKMLAHHIQADYRDVTDNKPRDHLGSFKEEALTESFRSMNASNVDRLNYELERLKTFDNNWPLDFIDKFILARTGMYYTGYADTTKCSFCGVEIGHWEETDHPVGEHVRWSPECPLMRRRQTNNIPINEGALNRILPPVSYDVCGANEVRTTTNSQNSNETTSSSSSSSFSHPDHPEYIIESARVRSFAEWPRTLKQKPAELAEAGFFYTGKGDRVMCFSCGGGLKDWSEDDDPWREHALWFKNCNYLKLIKGQKYIDAVHEKRQNDTKNQDSAQSQSPVEDLKKEASTSHISSDRLSQLEADDEKPLDDKSCKICYANDYNTAFLPCAHVVACVKCAASVTKCPVCREPITNVTRLYFS